MFEIELRDEGCMAEATIKFNGEVIGYVGGSRYTERCQEGAEEAIRDACAAFFAPLIEAVKAHREVDAVSRFDDYDEDWG